MFCDWSWVGPVGRGSGSELAPELISRDSYEAACRTQKNSMLGTKSWVPLLGVSASPQRVLRGGEWGLNGARKQRWSGK